MSTQVTIKLRLFSHQHILLLLMLLLVGIRLPMLANPLLDHFNFRQTQTALTAYWFVQDGFSLPAYPLPILGPPWSLPLEFPVFQMVIAFLNFIGLSMDPACRLAAILVYASAVAVMVRLFTRLEARPSALWVFVGFCALAPFAIVWSRACLIDYTSVLLALVYLYICVEARLKGWTTMRFASAVLIGVLAAASKISTFPVFWTPASFMAAAALWGAVKRLPLVGHYDWMRLMSAIGIWLLVLIVPIAGAGVWTHISDEIKAQSPATSWLTSEALNRWNFGTLEQRLDGANWECIHQRLRELVVPWTLPLVPFGIVTLFRQSRTLVVVVLGLVIGSLATLLVFFPLYVRHDYYLCNISLPVWLIAAIGLSELAGYYKQRAWRVACCSLPLALVAVISANSAYVDLSYNYTSGVLRDGSASQLVLFARRVMSKTPVDAQLIIFGDDWNSRIPYYTRRKALMVRENTITDAYVVQYAARNSLCYVVAPITWKKRVRSAWPHARKISSAGYWALFTIQPDASE